MRHRIASVLAAALLMTSSLARSDEIPSSLLAGIDAAAAQPTPLVAKTTAPAVNAAEPVTLPASPLNGSADFEVPGGGMLPVSSTLNEAAPSAGYVVGSDTNLKVQWKNGLEAVSANKDFRVHVGGRTQIDASWYATQSPLENPPAVGGIGPNLDSINFRRARLRVDGMVYEVIDFAMEYEFSNQAAVGTGASPVNVPVPTDLWATVTKLPLLGNVRFGNFKPFIGLEHMTSSRYLDFMERSFNQDAYTGPFNNGFSPGIGAFRTIWDDRASWAFGVFGAGNNPYGFSVGDGEYQYVGRLTALPYYQQEGRYMVHLGAAGSIYVADAGSVRIRSRGNIRSGPPGPLNPIYADTGTGLSQQQDMTGLEFLTIWGPLQVQAEYIGSWFQNATFSGIPRGTMYTQGGYVELLYFLTGEHRPYSLERSAPDRIVPNENFFLVGDERGRRIRGRGAWQVGIRYDGLDLNDKGVNGGILNAMTLGVNWFLNPNMKFQWNYDWLHRSSVAATPSGDIYSFGTRFAIDY